MRRYLPESLKGLLLLNEGAFVVLLLVTAAVGVLSAWHWHQSFREAVRINALLQGAERIRGDMYGQVEEVIRARLTEDPSVLDRYTPFGERIDRRFQQLQRLTRDEDERRALRYLRDSYQVVLADMNKVFTDPYDVTDAARMKLLDRAHEEWMLADFESALTVFGEILARRQQELEEALGRWTRVASVLYPLPLALALLVVVLSVRRLHRHVLRPMEALTRNVQHLSRGDLERRLAEAGVQEVRGLARAFNDMARDLAASRDAQIAAERQAALGALVPVVAHNIRNPLASIRATAQLLDARESAEELLETRQAIIDSVDQLERWVRTLLSYLHPLQPRRQTMRLGRVLDGACALIHPRLQQRGLRLERTGRDRDRECPVDPDLLEQALYGLLNNAVEASPEGAVITLGLDGAPGGDAAVVFIEDRGPGMSFEPRPTDLGPGPTTKPYGTGLGIPFAFKVVQAHGGDLSFQRGEAGGTRVTVTLPAASGSDVHAAAPAAT